MLSNPSEGRPVWVLGIPGPGLTGCGFDLGSAAASLRLEALRWAESVEQPNAECTGKVPGYSAPEKQLAAAILGAESRGTLVTDLAPHRRSPA